MNKNKIFNLIQTDIEKIDKQLDTKNGSGELWKNLRTQYSLLIPDIISSIKSSNKMSVGFEEFDYRPELKQLKSALLTWVFINEEDLEVEGNYISNESNVLINTKFPNSTEEDLMNLIVESKIYISKDGYNEKKIGLEKIWDAFERLKTLKDSDKKKSVNEVISIVSNNNEDIFIMLENEFDILTKIGNSYSIRHSEITQKKLSNSSYIEYLYFRMLSLVSLVLELIECK